jgi:hypothetical protein
MRPLALWATPRTVSTAFDKMIRARGDHLVLTEPFSVAWYHGPERRSPRFGELAPDATFAAVLGEVLALAGRSPVFVKDMAYQLGPLLRPDVLAWFRSSFLIRDPAWTIPSLLRKWPDAGATEAGYHAQLAAYRICCDLADGTPPVIDSDDLRADPAGIVARWCDAMGVQHLPGSLQWEPGTPEGWERWSDWFATAASSTGFHPPEAGDPPRPGPAAAELIDRCRPAYEELRRAALRA